MLEDRAKRDREMFKLSGSKVASVYHTCQYMCEHDQGEQSIVIVSGGTEIYAKAEDVSLDDKGYMLIVHNPEIHSIYFSNVNEGKTAVLDDDAIIYYYIY